MVSANITVSGAHQNVPRLPADRVGLGLQWKNEFWNLGVDYLHVDAQNEVAEYELPTDGYQDLSLSIMRDWNYGDIDVQFFVKGKNLTNDEQRYHASFVKDLAPAPGRSVEAGIRLAF